MKAPEFKEKYEQHYEPCVIDNIPFYEKWLGNIFQPNSTTQIADESNEHSWTIQNLKKRFKNALLKVGKADTTDVFTVDFIAVCCIALMLFLLSIVGEDDDGKRVRVKLKYFLQYMKNNVDDSPLYVFDGSFDDNLLAKSLLEDYKVPSYFTDDLFHLVGEKRRPPYRWFLIGPERSGSSVHIDPLGTSAWNTLLYGRKRWVLFPPGTPRNIAKGKDVIKTGEDDEAINYFVDLLPRIKEKYCNTSSAHTGENIQVIEFIQNAGETVFVPGGWWHGVLNLEDTVAVTQVLQNLL